MLPRSLIAWRKSTILRTAVLNYQSGPKLIEWLTYVIHQANSLPIADVTTTRVRVSCRNVSYSPNRNHNSQQLPCYVTWPLVVINVVLLI